MSDKNEIEAVLEYLQKKQLRSLKRITLGSELNHKIFILTVALVAVLPLIPVVSKKPFHVPTIMGDFDYVFLCSIFFGILIGLLAFNILLGLINIKRKVEYGNLVKEIQKLKSIRV